jgi:hypothetical protein
MRKRLVGLARGCCLVLRVVLAAALVAWAAAAPLVWILRDGLGPDSVESTGAQAVVKFAAQWGVPALAVAAPIAILTLVDRRLAAPPDPE